MTQATPLPWSVCPLEDKRHRSFSIMSLRGANRKGEEDGPVNIASCHDHHVTRETAEANARLIVNAVNYFQMAPQRRFALCTALSVMIELAAKKLGENDLAAWDEIRAARAVLQIYSRERI